MKLPSNVVDDSNDDSSANIKLSKTYFHKTEKSGGFLGRLLGQLIKTRLPLIENALKTLAKSILIPLELPTLPTAASVTEAAIHKKTSGSGNTTLTISNEEIKDIMK